jgi:hypothetical protein
MSGLITAKIDVLKIDKTKLFRGKSGTYLDIVLLPNKGGTDQYGNDFMIVQGTTKEDREAGRRGEILGNGKWMGQKAEAKPAAQPAPPYPERDENQLPF